MKKISFSEKKYGVGTYCPYIEIFIDDVISHINITPSFYIIGKSMDESYINLANVIIDNINLHYDLPDGELNVFYCEILHVCRKEGMIIQSF